jgi:UDP-N-acetyl-D-glucosamine dehydrogenase
MRSHKSQHILVLGQGYVGLPLAVIAVEKGHFVTGFDTNADRIERLLAADSYVEDISNERLLNILETGRFHATAKDVDCEHFDIAIITVPTPLRDHAPDLSFVRDAAAIVGRGLDRGSCVVLESTTYPGTTEEVLVPLLEEHSGLVAGRDFYVGFSPERIDPGNPTWNVANTPKVVAGIDATSLQRITEFYESILDTVVPVSSPRTAELAKLIENTFRHVNIALMNEIAMFAGDLDINIWEAIDAAATKPYGFMRFTPGPGVGGHCLPIDPSYLSWKVRQRLGVSFRFVELANEVNSHMPQYVVRRIEAALNQRKLPVNGTRILLLGLAYKKNSSDARESPAIAIAQQLVSLGADVHVVDPHVTEQPNLCGTRVDLCDQEVRDADAVILLTDHDDLDYSLLAQARYVLDTRNRAVGPNVERL